jgi:hypothetical protein
MKITVEDLFKKAEIDWTQLKPGDFIDISDKNIKVKCFNEKTDELEYRKVLSLIRKENSETFRILDSSKKEKFRASLSHRVLAKIRNKWTYNSLNSLGSSFIGLTDKGKEEEFFIEKTNNVEPILDFEVEENSNYFSNGILSHNTTPGGNALKFYASIRLEIKRKDWILEGDDTVGITIYAKSVKNKTSPPNKKHYIDMSFTKGFDSHLEWIDYAIQYDIIQNPGQGTFILFNGTKLRGKAKVIDFYSDPANSEEYEKVIAKTKEKMYASSKIERVSVDSPEDEKEVKELLDGEDLYEEEVEEISEEE